jgi:hypothetical protein
MDREKDDEILKDGEVLRVPLPLMDEDRRQFIERAQQAINEKPPVTAEEAYDRYVQELGDAWRPKPVAQEKGHG